MVVRLGEPGWPYTAIAPLRPPSNTQQYKTTINYAFETCGSRQQHAGVITFSREVHFALIIE